MAQRKVAAQAETTLTVGDLVARLAGLTSDPSAMTERIRHWTREQLLTPVGQHHEGTGKYRRYSLDSAYYAAVLNVVAYTGLHVATQRYLVDALSMARHSLRRWKQGKIKGSAPSIFLEISFVPPGKYTTDINDGTKGRPPNAALVITIDLGQLFERVWSENRRLIALVQESIK